MALFTGLCALSQFGRRLQAHLWRPLGSCCMRSVDSWNHILVAPAGRTDYRPVQHSSLAWALGMLVKQVLYNVFFTFFPHSTYYFHAISHLSLSLLPPSWKKCSLCRNYNRDPALARGAPIQVRLGIVLKDVSPLVVYLAEQAKKLLQPFTEHTFLYQLLSKQSLYLIYV